jgi:hypothetical protein
MSQLALVSSTIQEQANALASGKVQVKHQNGQQEETYEF